MRLRAICAVALLAAASCRPQPQPARPALWEITGPNNQRGWLFGTIHSLSTPAQWHSAVLDKNLAASDQLVLEIAAADEDQRTAATFARLQHAAGLLPLPERINPELRPPLAKLLYDNHLDVGSYTTTKTWAAALILAQLTHKAGEAENGIDRALIAAMPHKPRGELEGVERQLAIFDSLPEESQRAMLTSMLDGSENNDDDSKLEEGWRKGDMGLIDHATYTGMLTDPGLHQALYVDRNLNWAKQIEAMLKAGKHPFVAVGAAHMAGEQGLPALLAKDGLTVKRVQ